MKSFLVTITYVSSFNESVLKKIGEMEQFLNNLKRLKVSNLDRAYFDIELEVGKFMHKSKNILLTLSLFSLQNFYFRAL